QDAPQPKPVQVAAGDGEVLGEQLDVGGDLRVLQQRAGQPLAGLHIGGELLDVFGGGGEVRAVRGQNFRRGISQPVQLRGEEHEVAHRLPDLRAVGADEAVDVADGAE